MINVAGAHSGRRFLCTAILVSCCSVTMLAIAEDRIELSESSSQTLDDTRIQNIDGSGIQAIDGSGIRRTPAHGIRQLDASSIESIDGSGINWTALTINCNQPIVQGPITILGDNKIVILNRVFLHSLDSQIFSQALDFQMAALYGHVHEQQLRISRIAIGEATYVPGSSLVSITDKISSLNAALGRMKVGGQTVDYTAIMQEASSLAVGDFVTISGHQPLPGGVIQAAQVCLR